ncbi:MAG: DSD1 family PLP-dependent enzyme [Ignavibacteriales bacterium]|nr:DSD1 family PLP-dependent enzyme [Ignavibacteriales bacterium]
MENYNNTNKYELDTPCLLLDLEILEQNIEKMISYLNANGKSLRPHAKTHKCSALAKKQIEMGAKGICVAKISEAEKLANAGLRNILITGPVVTKNKIERLIKLLQKDASIIIVVDNQENILHLNELLAEKKNDLKLNVLIDFNIGLNRTGIDAKDTIKLAELINKCSNLILCGIQAYAGNLQHIQSYVERKKLSINSLSKIAEIFSKLKTEIPTCKIFSTSGTGTFDIDIAIPEITELQAGSYIFMDMEYLGIESQFSESNISFKPSLTVLSTVVSSNQEKIVTIDAGLKSIYKDGGIPKIIFPRNSNLVYDWFGDEYGKLTAIEKSPLPKIGEIVELITSHCDPTVNLYNKYILTRGDKVAGLWDIDLRGCSE